MSILRLLSRMVVRNNSHPIAWPEQKELAGKLHGPANHIHRLSGRLPLASLKPKTGVL